MTNKYNALLKITKEIGHEKINFLLSMFENAQVWEALLGGNDEHERLFYIFGVSKAW